MRTKSIARLALAALAVLVAAACAGPTSSSFVPAQSGTAQSRGVYLTTESHHAAPTPTPAPTATPAPGPAQKHNPDEGPFGGTVE